MTPLVLLHGFTGSPASFDQLALGPALAPALLGHGAPGAPAESFCAEVDRIAALLPARSHLVGYSLGARVALGILLEHPHRVARATLIGCHPGLTAEADRRARILADRRWIRTLEDDGIERFVAEWEALPLWKSQRALPRDVRAAQRAIRLAHDPLGLAASLRVLGLAEMPDYGARLGEIRAPVELVVGRFDAKFRALAEQMRARIDGARVTLIADSGHNPILERPDRVAALIHRPERKHHELDRRTWL